MYNKLVNILGSGNVLRNEMMANHTTLKIGGPADYFVTVNTEGQLLIVLGMMERENIPYYIVGNGSNILVSDKGFRGVIIRLAGDFKNIKCVFSEKEEVIDDRAVQTAIINAGGGCMLSQVATVALENDLTGLEFAAGIPGTIGGATIMNAGAYNGEMKDIVVSARVIEKGINNKFQITDYTNNSLKFGYRTSAIKSSKYGGIVLSASLKLIKGDYELIKDTMNNYALQRKDKQPLDFPSAGSTFKRPMGNFAGKLISEAGLRGYRVGDAMVSTKHAGFCVNAGNASARDFNELMKQVAHKVFLSSGVTLEPEIVFLGDFS